MTTNDKLTPAMQRALDVLAMDWLDYAVTGNHTSSTAHYLSYQASGRHPSRMSRPLIHHATARALAELGLVRVEHDIPGHQFKVTLVRVNAVEAAEDNRDQAMIDAYEDDRRVFQALCTERDRLYALRAAKGYSATAAAQRRAYFASAVDRTAALVERYAAKVRGYYTSAMQACECVPLPSGRVYKCEDHGGKRS